MGRIVLNHGHVNACAFRTLFKMTISTQFVTLQVLATLYSTVEALNTATNNKAASQYVNCDCQCSSLTFQDKFGRTQGNCKTADNTGATWCYVDSRSSCLDKQRSVRFSLLNASSSQRSVLRIRLLLQLSARGYLQG